MLILLPPSEGKTVPTRGAPLDLEGLAFPGLTDARRRMVEVLVEHCAREPERAASTLGLGPTQGDLVTRNAGLFRAPTARADRVYSGVLYDALDVASLDPAARRRATRRLVVTSALFGLVRSDDRIPSYRLSADTSLPGIGPVAGVWRAELGQAVTEALGQGLLLDLRSTGYAAFWRPGRDLAHRVATVRVWQEVGGRRTVVSHFNKATKGLLVRGLLTDGAVPRTPGELAEVWGDLGWDVELGEPGRGGTRVDVITSEAGSSAGR